ncbi:MAG: hypothetical protein A4C66_11820 [Nitrospira sp. HN-bin3]|jgi:hypothetical protein|uniref:hypothetical protein n=1 Tax=Nitrospira cf. moscoviensis SBR1015 TaxID=96242 RepID=UPI000A0A579C|nr:hypothetical protein [Nitrospira cf. moscoviensis SBR1015]OQW38366.1 MAG: hypothetical protein A4C66_11820 [Nitrospira sp. HN-bin3]
MERPGLDKHQLAGLDDRERGFSRPVEFEQAGEGYRAVLRYEAVRVTTDTLPTQDQALTVLIQSLHAQGYRQLKTQLSFRNGLYLGSQELWVEYPDPPQAEPQPSGFLQKIKDWFRPRPANGQ